MRKLARRINRYYRRILFRSILFWRRNKNRYFYLSLKGGIPKIHINDQYEEIVKWILRIFTVVGIISSVVAFPEWFLNLLFALLLLAIEQFLEKAVFMYFTFYITAIPKLKPDDWKGMVWIHTEKPSDNYFEVGIMFSSRESAERVFPVIKHWSKNGDNDSNNMVQVSVIINDLDYYHVYIYPNADKDPAYVAVKEQREKEQPQKEHKMDIVSIMLCKGFNYSRSSFPQFQKFYRGEPYYLSAYVVEDKKPVRLSHLGAIRKDRLKIKREEELQKNDPEYEHARFIVDFDKYEKEPTPEASREYVGYNS